MPVASASDSSVSRQHHYLGQFDATGYHWREGGLTLWISPYELRVSSLFYGRDIAYARERTRVRFETPTILGRALEVSVDGAPTEFVMSVSFSEVAHTRRALATAGWTAPLGMTEVIIPCRATRWPGRGWLVIGDRDIRTEFAWRQEMSVDRHEVRVVRIDRSVGRKPRLVVESGARSRLRICRLLNENATADALARAGWRMGD